MKIRTKVSTTFCCATLLSAGIAAANTPDLAHRTVPASACQPLTSVQAAKVKLHNGGWEFDGNNTGAVSFYCPISLNRFFASGLGQGNQISQLRIYYRDSDGTNVSARVTVGLRYRIAAGEFVNPFTLSGPLTFNSNAVGGPLDTGHTSYVHSYVHDLQWDALYSFYVTLERSSALQSPAFHGLDFYSGRPQG
jgi:hypothetical protein